MLLCNIILNNNNSFELLIQISFFICFLLFTNDNRLGFLDKLYIFQILQMGLDLFQELLIN